MKILKAALLTFIISFAFSTVNAQIFNENPPCLSLGFSMTITDVELLPDGETVRLKARVTNSVPERLTIEIGNCSYISPNKTTVFEKTIELSNGDCGIPDISEFTVYCGIRSQGCYDGCIVEVDN